MEVDEKYYKREASLCTLLTKLFNLHHINYLMEYPIKHCRCDFVIVKNNKIVCIIEVKRPYRKKPINITGRQYKKYSVLGLPLLYIADYNDVLQLINKIELLLSYS